MHHNWSPIKAQQYSLHKRYFEGSPSTHSHDNFSQWYNLFATVLGPSPRSWRQPSSSGLANHPSLTALCPRKANPAFWTASAKLWVPVAVGVFAHQQKPAWEHLRYSAVTGGPTKLSEEEGTTEEHRRWKKPKYTWQLQLFLMSLIRYKDASAKQKGKKKKEKSQTKSRPLMTQEEHFFWHKCASLTRKSGEKKRKIFSILGNTDSQDPAKSIFFSSLQQHLDNFVSSGCSCTGNIFRRKIFPLEKTLQNTW